MLSLWLQGWNKGDCHTDCLTANWLRLQQLPHLIEWILMSPRYVGLNGSVHTHTHTHTHTDTNSTWSCCRGLSLACSSVVMDTPRHIRHPISGGMLSASEGLAPCPPTPLHLLPQTLNPHSLSPSPQNWIPVPYSPWKTGSTSNRLSACQLGRPGSTQQLSCPSVGAFVSLNLNGLQQSNERVLSRQSQYQVKVTARLRKPRIDV